VIKTHMQFIEDCFHMETGLKAVSIFQEGFNKYMINASDGKVYHYTC